MCIGWGKLLFLCHLGKECAMSDELAPARRTRSETCTGHNCPAVDETAHLMTPPPMSLASPVAYRHPNSVQLGRATRKLHYPPTSLAGGTSVPNFGSYYNQRSRRRTEGDDDWTIRSEPLHSRPYHTAESPRYPSSAPIGGMRSRHTHRRRRRSEIAQQYLDEIDPLLSVHDQRGSFSILMYLFIACIIFTLCLIPF